MTAVMRIIEARSLTQTKAAQLFGVTQPRISDLNRGKIERFTLGRPREHARARRREGQADCRTLGSLVPDRI